MKRILAFLGRWVWTQMIKFIGNVWQEFLALGVLGTVAYFILKWKGLIE